MSLLAAFTVESALLEVAERSAELRIWIWLDGLYLATKVVMG